MFARDPEGLVAAGVVVSPTAAPEALPADVAGAAVVLVVAEFPLELVLAAVVVVVVVAVPEPWVIRKGAENTLGAVKSF